MTSLEHRFRTTSVHVRPRHLVPSGDMQNFRDTSRFRRLVAMRPGRFLPLVPRTPEVLIPRVPDEFTEAEVVAPRKYLGRLESRTGAVLDCTLWEVPNGRELVATLNADDPDVTCDSELTPGARLEVWTWQEPQQDGSLRERVHVRRRPTSVAPPPLEPTDSPVGSDDKAPQ